MLAPFPTPPPFWQSFTKPNIAKLRQLRKGAAPATEDGNGEQQIRPDILALPTELRYLVPPAPPSPKAPFTAFGMLHDPSAAPTTLADLDVPQLYPDHPSVRLNPQAHLITLARSMLTTYLSLLDTLSEEPTLYAEKVKHLETLVFNLQDLVNGYRPHQARETLIRSMEERLEGLRDEVGRIKVGTEEGRRTLSGLRGGTVGDMGQVEAVKGAEGLGAGQDRKRRERQKAAWAALEAGLDDG